MLFTIFSTYHSFESKAIPLVAIVILTLGIFAGSYAWNKVFIAITKNPKLSNGNLFFLGDFSQSPPTSICYSPVLENCKDFSCLFLLAYYMVPNSQEQFKLEKKL